MDLKAARQLLYEDALLQQRELMSAAEWEERVREEKLLREAAEIVGQVAVDAISKMLWRWDRPTRKMKRVQR